MFREDLPGIIHRLSQQWVKAKVEAPYLSKRPPLSKRRPLDTMSNPEVVMDREFEMGLGVHPQLSRQALSTSPGSHRPRSVSGVSTVKSSTTASISQSQLPPTDVQSSSHSDLENFDPTYGLRPEGLPTKSLFQGFRSLFTLNKGLADLAEESETSDYEDEEEGTSFDVVDWEETVPGFSPTPSVCNDRDREHDSTTEYETVPAVGGGTIMRPRIYHSQSAIQSHPTLNPLTKSHPPHSRPTVSQNGILYTNVPAPSTLSSTVSSPYFADYPAGPTRLPGFRSPLINNYLASPRAPSSPDSLESHQSRSSSGPSRTLSTNTTDPASYEEKAFPSFAPYATVTSGVYRRRPLSERRMSITSTTSAGNANAELLSNSLPNNNQEYGGDSIGIPKIILPPTTNNNSIHQLSTLSHSNRTLSPYTRDLSHFTVRSVPPRNLSLSGLGIAGFGAGVSGGDRQPVKARRKRMYRVGGQMTAPAEKMQEVEGHGNISRRASPSPPSEFDMSEMDRYFPRGGFEGMPQSLPGGSDQTSRSRPSPVTFSGFEIRQQL